MLKIIGFGAQAKYVIDVLTMTMSKSSIPLRVKIYSEKGVGGYLGGCYINRFSEDSVLPGDDVVICSSSPQEKEKIRGKLDGRSCNFPNIIHPRSITSPNIIMGEGNIINAGAIIQPFATIGNFTMIHAGAIIEHDCEIDDFANIAPGVILTGWTRVGKGAIVYSGSIAIPAKRIGKGSIVGAGSLILKDVPSKVKAYGSPIKKVSPI